MCGVLCSGKGGCGGRCYEGAGKGKRENVERIEGSARKAVVGPRKQVAA